MVKNIIVVEKDPILKDIIADVIRKFDTYNVVFKCSSFDELLQYNTNISIDLCLIGVDADREIFVRIAEWRRFNRNMKILITSSIDSEDLITEALRTGAQGFLTLDINYMNLIEALKTIFSGGSYLSPKAVNRIVESYHINPHSPFTRKENLVLKHFVNGNTYSEIGDIIGISKDTVKTHLKNIYRKARVNKKSELIDHIRKNKLVN